jgi:1-acyl-sn-glycerol-3-phosphate acyltransferase
MWETFALFCVFDDPAFVLKRELQWMPMFGWYTIKARSIPVNRKGGASALLAMNARAAEEAAAGRQIVIFPEGTRTAPGAPPSYKYGIAHMYEQMGMSCVPVGLNSGLFWPRRKFLRYPGTIVVEICEPIAPGLERDAFFALMKERIEASSDALLLEGRATRRG